MGAPQVRQLADILHINARWDGRPESREACARRTLAFLAQLKSAFEWELGREFQVLNLGKPMAALDLGTVFECLEETVDRSCDPPRVFSGPGVGTTFGLKSGDASATAIVRCGAWIDIYNHVQVFLDGPLKESLAANRAALVAIAEHFEPLYAAVFSGLGIDRTGAGRLPLPIVDWMVYIAEARIPPDELAMVHAVEHIGSGTLVILKKERLHLDRPDDLALVEAVEPIIRRYQKPPLPKETHPQRHDAAKH